MEIRDPQVVLLLIAVTLCVLFIAVFTLLVRDFDKRFSSYLRNSSDRSRLISNQLSTIYDTLLIISTILKPSCVDALKKYLIDPENSLLKDIYSCSQTEIQCMGSNCCCTCVHQKKLYTLNSSEELKSVAVICGAGGVDIISSEHGTCPLFEKR